MTKHVTKQIFLVVSLLVNRGIFSFAGPVELSNDKMVQPVAPVCDPRWYLSIGGGGEFNTGATDLQKSAIIAPTGVPIGEIRAHDFSDAYDVAFYRVEAEVGSVLTDRIEIFGQFNYAASATNNWIHRAVSINAGSPTFLSVKFDDYNSYGFQLGARYFFVSKEARLRPYFSIAGGASHVDSIGAESALESSNVVVSRSHFFDDSWVGTVTGLVGVEYSVSCHLAVGIHAGLGYSSTLTGDDTDLVGPVSKSNDDVGDRLYCPVAVYAKVRF